MSHNHLLLDTHTWIWFVNGDKTLHHKTCKLITDAITHHAAFIAAISTWELGMLEAKKRLRLSVPVLEWVEDALTLSGINIASLSPAIAIESSNLPGNFHEDPADRMIVATARVEGLILLTRDERILSYSKQKYINALKI